MVREAGILLSVSSLPSPYGIGTLGRSAFDFIDFLASAGQRYWQMLPVGPISYGDSPYQSFSTFAGNPYYIDLDRLVEEGLLTQREAEGFHWGEDPRRVDYGAIYRSRFALLERAFERGWTRDQDSIARFALEHRTWLADYALFMSLKRHFGMIPWTDWPDDAIRLRQPEAVAAYRRRLDRDVRFFTYLQYLFAQQWSDLRDYAQAKGVKLVGDLPIYVALDSSDVWSAPELFQLDRNNFPTAVSGVPPDGFSRDGQLWGNPLYDWPRMKRNGFAWWESRLRATLERFDVPRLDHFRGLESYWSVPAGASSAAAGHWEPGPGQDFLRMLERSFPDVLIIAEDLGYITDPVRALVDASGCPGMKVLEFAFDRREAGDYLPHNYPVNCVCYVGTHDNNTILGWFQEAASEDVETARAYFGLHEQEGWNWGMIRGGMATSARLFIAQMQDYLGLDGTARMNTPGRLGGNWQWRMLPGEASPELAQRLLRYTKLFGR